MNHRLKRIADEMFDQRNVDSSHGLTHSQPGTVLSAENLTRLGYKNNCQESVVKYLEEFRH